MAQVCEPFWSSVRGFPAAGHPSVNGPALVTFDDGSGPSLYVGGVFVTAPQPLPPVWRKGSGGWESVGNELSGSCGRLIVLDLGNGPRLFAYGYIGPTSTFWLKSWTGQQW